MCRMINFRDYLKSSGQSMTKFADRVGLSQSYLSELSSGRKTPSLETAYDIFTASGGKIPLTYWLFRDADGNFDPKAKQKPRTKSEK